MKITKLEDIDLSKYKLAYFQGDSFSHDTKSQDWVMKVAEADPDAVDSLDFYDNNLRIALIPKSSRLTECGGDDWDDESADDNASGFYKYPKGTIFLQGKLGTELKLINKFYD